MIGIVSRECERKAAEELFQLFRTPAEFYVAGEAYDVAIVTTEVFPSDLNARVVLIFNSDRTDLDDGLGICLVSGSKGVTLEWCGIDYPIYGHVSLVFGNGTPLVSLQDRSGVVGLHLALERQQVFRIGYDLLNEVSLLLSAGQPSGNARIPTLEIHISLLRECLLSADIAFLEIPPMPNGYDFMVCLTHDVDFVGIRDHKFDQTMWGFVYRALVSSFLDAIRGKSMWSKVSKNWKAVISLPFVHLGVQKDFWLEFNRYAQIEKGLGSTFFFLPFKNQGGIGTEGSLAKRRAAKYDLLEIEKDVRQLSSWGCEIGLHGIDAWQSPEAASTELNRIRAVSGSSEIGVRMHWLYFSAASPEILEEAGAIYDSTFGFNDAVGFRAGTSQVFRPIAAEKLLELPLNIQDTALFYPSRMGLSEECALGCCKRLIQAVVEFGGVLTVNWHTRSLSPERLWDEFYVNLLAEFRNHRVWFGTAGEIVSWFKNRRSLRFEEVAFEEHGLRVRIGGQVCAGQPAFLMRVYHPKLRRSVNGGLSQETPAYVDAPWRGEAELRIQL
jgi:hypothetical protein